MKIAIIGWGSLIWRKGQLSLSSKWHKDGAWLPVEFARISRDKRLTLVIVPEDEAIAQQTLWAYSGYSEIKQARNYLKEREGVSNIQGHSIEKTGPIVFESQLWAEIWQDRPPNMRNDHIRSRFFRSHH